MQSNYKTLGDFIQPIKVKNSDLSAKELLGINVDKFFMPSVANIVGTDLSNYKVVNKNQFACNRMHVGRDYRIPIALSDREEPFMVSPAYDVFEIIDTSILHPDYLMMWFSRKEYDRNAWFYTDADVRGGLAWDAFCNMKFPLPSPEKQREIVAEYNTVKNRIELNNQLIQKLEETAQAIYKQWFVNFEFPDENGNPYKSSGGNMVYNEELDKEIPEEWEVGVISDLVDVIDGDRGQNYPSIEDMSSEGHCLFLNAGNVTKDGFSFSDTKFITEKKDKILRKGKLERNDVVLTSRGTVGNTGFFGKKVPYNHIRINSGMVIFRPNSYSEASIFIYSMLRSFEMKKSIENFLSGSAQPQLPIKDLIKIPVIVPDLNTLQLFQQFVLKLQDYVDEKKLQNSKLKQLTSLLLSKVATIEN